MQLTEIAGQLTLKIQTFNKESAEIFRVLRKIVPATVVNANLATSGNQQLVQTLNCLGAMGFFHEEADIVFAGA